MGRSGNEADGRRRSQDEPVPELYCPVLPQVSLYAEELDARIIDWMAANRLYERPEQLRRYAGSGFGTFAARVCPDAEWGLLLLFARWLAFGFFYDDEFFDEGDSSDRTAPGAEAVMAAISVFVPDGVPPGLPRLGASDRQHRLSVAVELLTETQEAARPEQFGRFCTQMTLWFYSYLYEPLVRSSGAPLTVTEYATNRLYNIASAPYVTLAEIVTGCAVTAEELARPDVRRLSSLAAYEMAWCNDIHSAAREATVNDRVANLLSLLRSSGALDARQAMNEAVRLHDQTMSSFMSLEQAVAGDASTALLHYLRILRTWIRGHYDWCRETLRYSVRAIDTG